MNLPPKVQPQKKYSYFIFYILEVLTKVTLAKYRFAGMQQEH